MVLGLIIMRAPNAGRTNLFLMTFNFLKNIVQLKIKNWLTKKGEKNVLQNG